jgi:hypothetical protein
MSTISHWMRQFKSASARSAAVLDLLSPERIETRCREAEHTWRSSFWSPSTTLTTFLLQVLNSAKTVRAAVAELLADLVVSGSESELPSDDPSAYTQARQRLPEAVVVSTLRETTAAIRRLAADSPPLSGAWRNRRVVIADGSSVSMPDTPELQAAFPQPAGQRKGCGFPMARLLALFCWSTGAMLEVLIGSLHESELALFRTLLDRFGPGDVLLADRHYGSFIDIHRLRQRGADVVVRLHQRRSKDFRQGRPLGPEDRLVVWQRPPKWIPSCGISQEEFDALPETMELRMVRTTRTPPGFRSKVVVVVTTILDPAEASVDDLLALYRDRWMVELNLRSMKTTLKMEVLRGESVDIVRKEVFMHALLYNLIRVLMWEAARDSGRDVRRLSFAGTLHRLQRFAAVLLRSTCPADDERLLAVLLAWISGDKVPYRPGRMEPRRVKRRPKNYSRLTKPRAVYRKKGDTACR